MMRELELYEARASKEREEKELQLREEKALRVREGAEILE